MTDAEAAALNSQIEKLKAELASFQNPQKALDNTIELIRKIVRAKNGQPAEDDIFSGLIRVEDIRERTRLTEHNTYGHSFMRLLSDIGGDEWEVMEKIAEQEDHNFISQDGEERKEAILMKRANMPGEGQNINIAMPATHPDAIKEQGDGQNRPQPKKHFWNR